MASDPIDSPSPVTGRGLTSPGPRRPWLLIVASLLLAVLSIVLWAKWEESRVRAERLQAEIKQVYTETEALRTQATRAQQRVTQLERQLRETPPVQPPPAVARPKAPRGRQ
jgi:type VI protein secretion system component VasK